MKILPLSVVLVGWFVCQSLCFARLGEDEIQCEERYGFAKKDYVANDKTFPLITGVGAITCTYVYQGWRIRVGFLDGVAVREEYWKVTAPGRSVTMVDNEITAILDAEKGTGSWQPKGTKLTVNVPKMLQDHLTQMLTGSTWIRGDGTATATMDTVHLHLSMESLAAVQHDEEMKRNNEDKQRTSVPAF